MAYRNQTDSTPESLLNLYDFIERNTGLCGHANPGDAHLSAGGTTMMITSGRSSFDHESILLQHIEENPDLKIKHISLKKSITHGVRPYLEVVEA